MVIRSTNAGMIASTALRIHEPGINYEKCHTVCLDGEECLQLLLGHGCEIRGLVDPCVTVPFAACGTDLADDFRIRDLRVARKAMCSRKLAKLRMQFNRCFE